MQKDNKGRVVLSLGNALSRLELDLPGDPDRARRVSAVFYRGVPVYAGRRGDVLYLRVKGMPSPTSGEWGGSAFIGAVSAPGRNRRRGVCGAVGRVGHGRLVLSTRRS